LGRKKCVGYVEKFGGNLENQPCEKENERASNEPMRVSSKNDSFKGQQW
jgi:hypothetical protein